MSKSQGNQITVWVNVYDMSPKNRYTYPLGFGIFHSGIEVHDREFVYGGHEHDFTGIFQVVPKVGVPGIKFRESIKLGVTDKTMREIHAIIQRMSRTYTGRAYNILTKYHNLVFGPVMPSLLRNCNHFSDDFAFELCNQRIPGWINRLATIGALFPCAIAPESEWISPPTLESTAETCSTSKQQQ